MSQEKFIHSVYFWLKDDLSAEAIKDFEKGLESLTTIETVKHGYYGVPATTNRPIIDRSYSYSLILVFASKADHDVYQDHPVHDDFRETFGAFWHKITIYDCE